jgi:hypothetical protein
MIAADDIFTHMGLTVVPEDSEFRISPKQIKTLQRAIQDVLPTLTLEQESNARSFYNNGMTHQLKTDLNNPLIQWISMGNTLLADLLDLSERELVLKIEHIKMVVRHALFLLPARDNSEAPYLARPKANDWLLEHEVMNPRTVAGSPYFFDFISPHKDLVMLLDRLSPDDTALYASVCRPSRVSHHQFWRERIQCAVDENRVVYIVGEESIQLEIDERKTYAGFVARRPVYKPVHGTTLLEGIPSLPKTVIAFTSKMDAIFYAESKNRPIYTAVHGKLLPSLHLVNSQGINGPRLQCAVVNKKDCIILGAEFYPSKTGLAIFTGIDMDAPFTRTFCPTAFDQPNPALLKSKHQIRYFWHKNFMSNVDNPAAPNIDDLSNWLVGYCSYYLDHQGEKGLEKAEQIREYLQLTSRSYRGNDIEGFLQHRPKGEDSLSLEAIINHRRVGKLQKNSWGWEQINECFIKPQQEKRLGCW